MTKSMYVESTDIQIRNEAICQNCKHFSQHYIKMGQVHLPVLWGHCNDGAHKARKVYQTCKYFERAKL